MSSPIRRGTVLATLAALAFGATAPLLSRLGASGSPLTTAALLYAGAAGFAAASTALGRGARDAPLRREHLARLVAVAVLGAGLAPVALAWGIARTGATTGSLLLNVEAVFTVLLARVIYREPVGRRVGLALFAMCLGGASLTFATSRSAAFDIRGVLAIGVATFAWAADNTLTRKLADVRPLSVVFAKAALGASITAALALVTGARWASPVSSAGLLVCGALGYGASLVLYLRAQRLMGAGRTGSVFAVAPFVGAALASVTDHTVPSSAMALGAGLFGIGVYLHATERHAHRHMHHGLTHEHGHTHDDGHHDHTHDPRVDGEHSHSHTHRAVEHDHEHASDLHHEHEH